MLHSAFYFCYFTAGVAVNLVSFFGFGSFSFPYPFFWKYFSLLSLLLLIKGLCLFAIFLSFCPVLIPSPLHLSLFLFSLLCLKQREQWAWCQIIQIPSGPIGKQHIILFLKLFHPCLARMWAEFCSLQFVLEHQILALNLSNLGRVKTVLC